MDYLPVVLRRGRPLLGTLCSDVGSSRSVCPQGRLLALVNSRGSVAVHSLTGDSSRESVDSSDTFSSVQWVCPRQTSSSDCVLDAAQSSAGQLVGVGRGGDVRWWRVREEGERLSVELMALLMKSELGSELGRVGYAVEVSQLQLVGSSEGCILLLVNSALLCSLSLDIEFGRLTIGICLAVEPSLEGMRDNILPARVGRVVDIVFCSPLFLQLCHEGTVFIHHVELGVCVGVVSTVQYCHYTSGGQPESEELLAKISTTQFTHLAVTSDLSQLAVTTNSKHILLVNLPDYFEVFPGHYHPQLLSSTSHPHHPHQPSHSKKRHRDSDSIISEEEEEIARHQGTPSEKSRSGGGLLGRHTWEQRWKALSQRIVSFDPKSKQRLSFAGASSCTPSPDSPLAHGDGDSVKRGKRKHERVKASSGGIEKEKKDVKKMWYEGPSVTAVGDLTFELPFITNLGKTKSTSLRSNSTNKSHSGTNDSSCGQNGTGLCSYYATSTILPPLWGEDTPDRRRVVCVSVQVGRVVVYCGERGGNEADKAELGCQEVDSCQVNGVVVYQTGAQSCSFTRCHRPVWLLPSPCPSLPLYLLSTHTLSLATFSLSQEQFVSKVLMYGSAVVAEEVCRVNRWDRCSLPINTLETALQLRQLDTVSFFLRSRGDSQSTDSHEPAGSPVVGPVEAPSLPPIPLEQLDTAIHLLLDAVHKNHDRSNASPFASCLLIMTLAFIIRLIKGQALFDEKAEERGEEERESEREGEAQAKSPLLGENGNGSRYRTVSGTSVDSGPPAPSHHPPLSLSSLTGYVQQLRAYLPNASTTGLQEPKEGTDGESQPPSLSPPGSPILDKKITNTWDQMDTKEVVRDALLKGCLPLAQVYLLHHHTPAKQQPSLLVRESASLSAVMATGCGFVLESLEERSVQFAISLLTQMCMDVQSSLRHVCFHTINTPLRDFLAEELKVRGWLSESESQSLDYLHLLESYYTLQSYEQAQTLHSQQQTRPMAYQSTSLPFVPGILTKTTSRPPVGDLHQLFPETFGGTHTLSHEDTSLASPSLPSLSLSSSKGGLLYLQVPLCVVLNWDQATRQCLLYEAFVLKNQTHGTECAQLVDKKQVFDYRLRHTDSESALGFIMSRVPPLASSSHCPSEVASLCSDLSQCVSHLRDSILDELGRQGVFIHQELQSLPLLLTRLGRTHSLFSHPHPLSKTQDHALSPSSDPPLTPASDGESLTADNGALLSLEDFHASFFQYCVSNGFSSLLYHYLDWYSLAEDEASISALGLADLAEEQPWVDTLLKFRLLALDSTDPDIMFQTSLSCSRLLLGVPGGVVMEMLQCNRTLMAMATLVYAPVPIEEALSPNSADQPWHVDPVVLKSSVAAYPTLQAALFPPRPTSLTAAQSQDISIYKLLQGTVPFDVSRLFKWQTTNTLANVEDTTDGPPVIPHFSQPALASKYARVEHLSYLYYLSRGQPSFAFANFMVAKLLGRSNPTKRIDRAVSRVYRLAMQDFTNTRLVSSCVAFLEMVDRDSRLLRVDTQAAVRIACHTLSPSSSPPLTEKLYSQPRTPGDAQKNTKIASQFIQLMYGSSAEEHELASGLLGQLETATHNLLSSSPDRCSLEAEEQWSLVQAFCVSHSLPPSTAFLSVCAEHSQWLPLLCHAQLYHIPPQKVLPIIEKSFSNPHIQEHLRLALSSMDPTGPSTLAASQRGGGEGSARPRWSRRKRTNSRVRMQQDLQQKNLRRAQPDIRAKLYSKIGLQRERSPQPDSAKQDKTQTRPSSTSTANLTDHPTEEESPPALSPDNLPDDLFAILFKCQSQRCPWRALLAHSVALQRPLLAILAACNQDAVMVDCMCVWLYCTLGFEHLTKATALLGIMDEQEDMSMAYLSPALQWRHWSSQDLALLLAVSLQLPPSHTAPHFTLAFCYFDQKNPLYSFFKFHEQFTLYCNLDQCKNHLLEFDLAISKCGSAVGGGYLGLVGDLCWVEKLANTVTSHMLVICPTPFEREHLLRLLHDGAFGQGFQCSGLDFRNLYQMTEVLREAGLPTDAAFTIREHFNFTPGAKSLTEVHSVRVRVDSDRVLGMLLEKAQFDVARRYASLVGSPANEVTVKEAEHNLQKLSESSYWQYEQARLNFWYSCNTSFTREKVDAELAAEFFESVVHHASDLTTPTPLSPSSSPSSSTSSSHSFPPLTCTATERALLLAFALKWRRETDTMTADQMKDFEREIWRSHIRASVEEMQRSPGDKTGGSPLPFLPTYTPENILSSKDPSSLLSTLSITVSPAYSGQRNLAELALPDNVPVLTEPGQHRDTPSTLTDPQEVKMFNMMLGRLLNAGYISQARELATLFEHDSPDLTIVLCCIQLAQGKLSTEQLTDEVLSLVSTHSPRHLSSLSLGLDSQQGDERGGSRPSAEILRMMQRLSDRAKHAQQCCSCIATCFKIAVCLHMSYTSVVTSDPYSILTQVLSSRFTDRYQLAKKFVSDCNLKSREVAGFLSECVASSLKSQIGISMRERDSPHSRVYYPQMTSAQFVELAQLCPDHNEVGGHLISLAKSLFSSQQPTTQNISVQVELLVRAHDCYTLGCSVDGVAEVLLVVRQWVPGLINLKHFSYVVRLLTGIGRFYEMAYILQVLMENDQFESLLHTGLEKEEQLRVALMDYLQTHHPNDHEKMQMVALKFGMFYELANTKQEQAKRDLRRIKPKHLASSNPETIKTLKGVFESLRTAAKTYSQEEYLTSAQQCYSLARLVALQLSHLHSSGKQVINLDTKGVVKLMEELPFQEALIVADAYRRTSWTDWVGPLYKKVVVGGHFRYLNDYKTAFPLKANMFQELSSRYQHDRDKSPEAAANMRRLLTHLHNLPLKRKIATDLGLSDVLQSLSPTQDEGFLNDIARL